MGEPADTNAAIWKSAEAVEAWTEEAERQERSRQSHRRFMAVLLPFAEQDEFTFLDLGAGPGAASRVILDLYPRSTAVLADFSAEMMRASEREMERFAGRYRYVQFDMSGGGEWPAAIPAALGAVVTSMCVHHLPDERKQSLFAEIFDHLAPGGWYLNYDPVRAEDPLVEATGQRVAVHHDQVRFAARRQAAGGGAEAERLRRLGGRHRDHVGGPEAQLHQVLQPARVLVVRGVVDARIGPRDDSRAQVPHGRQV